MSFDVILQHVGEAGDSVARVCTSKRKIQEGGTQVMGGTNNCELNITYNYSEYYHEIFPVKYNQVGNGTITTETTGLRWLSYKTGAEAIPILEECVQRLGTKRHEDYWKPTSGNAGYALNILLEWSREVPSAQFVVY